MGGRRVKIGASNNGNNKVVTEMPNFVTLVPLPTSNPMSATSIAVELNKSSRRISGLLITELSSLFRQQYQNFLLADRLLGPARFDASKLKVEFMGEEMNNYVGIIPRTYILSHCDLTANVTLTISNVINLEQELIFSFSFRQLRPTSSVNQWCSKCGSKHETSMVTVRGIVDPPKLIEHIRKQLGKHAEFVKQEEEIGRGKDKDKDKAKDDDNKSKTKTLLRAICSAAIPVLMVMWDPIKTK